MEPVELATPSGYRVTLKPYLNYGQFIQIQQIFTSRMKLKINTSGSDPQTEGATEIDASVLYDANKKALEFLLLKVIMPDGQESNNPVVAIDEMPPQDGIAVMDRINEITNQATTTQKKIAK